MQPYPRSLDLIWPGHLHGTACLSARAVDTGPPTVVRRLCLGPGCSWVWVLLTPPVLAGVLGGCVWARFVVLSLFCRLFVVFVVGLRFRPAYGTCVVACALRLPPAVSGSGVRCWRACWARVSAVPRPSWLGCPGVFFALFFSGLALWCQLLGVPVLGLVAPVPPSPFFWAGRLALFFFFSWCVSACFGVLFSSGPLFLAWCCRLWLGGPPVPLWGSCLRCLLGGGFRCLLWCWRAAWWLWVVFAPPPPPPPCFFCGVGGLPVPPSAFPGLAHALARSQCGLLGCCWWLRSVWPCSGPMGRVGYVHVGLGAPSCRVRSWLPAGRLRQAAACGSGLGGWGCSSPFSSAVPVLTFWVVRHRFCRARGGPVCGLRCPCVACWCGAFRAVRWLASVSPSG